MRFLLALVVVVGCAEPVTWIEATSHVESFIDPVLSPRELDVLFVIDTSPRMAQHTGNVVQNAQTITDGLVSMNVDLRIAAITTDPPTDFADRGARSARSSSERAGRLDSSTRTSRASCRTRSPSSSTPARAVSRGRSRSRPSSGRCLPRFFARKRDS